MHLDSGLMGSTGDYFGVAGGLVWTANGSRRREAADGGVTFPADCGTIDFAAGGGMDIATSGGWLIRTSTWLS